MSPKIITRSVQEGISPIIKAKLSILKCQGRRTVIVRSKQRSFGSESLEHAIQVINKFIFEHDQRRQRQRARRFEGKGGAEVEVLPVSKPITFKASARTEKLVKEPPASGPSSRSLSSYLALPLDQYSLLDPGWISRSPIVPDAFVLRIPLFDLVGLDLQPQITVRASLDPRNSQVHFHADQFKVGDPRFDADFKLNMRATLRNKPVPTLRPLRSIKRMWARAGSSGRDGGEADPGRGGQDSPGSQAPASTRGDKGEESASSAASVVDMEGDTVVDGDGDGEGNRTTSAEFKSSLSSSSNSNVSKNRMVDVPAQGALTTTPDAPPHASFVQDAEIVPKGSRMDDISATAPTNGIDINSVVKEMANEIPLVEKGSSSHHGSGSDGSSRFSGHGSASNSINGHGGNSTRTSTCTANSICNGSSGAAATVTKSVDAGSNNSDGYKPQALPAASYGAAHPAARAAGTARSSDRIEAVPSTSATLERTRITSPTATKSASTATPQSSSRPSSTASRSLPVARGSASLQPAELDGLALTLASPSVTPTVTPPSPIPMPQSDSGQLPFIENSVLYVPANQWGREANGQGGSAAGAYKAASTVADVVAVATAAVPITATATAYMTASARDAITVEADAPLPGPVSVTSGVCGITESGIEVSAAEDAISGSSRNPKLAPGRQDMTSVAAIATATSTAAAGAAAFSESGFVGLAKGTQAVQGVSGDWSSITNTGKMSTIPSAAVGTSISANEVGALGAQAPVGAGCGVMEAVPSEGAAAARVPLVGSDSSCAVLSGASKTSLSTNDPFGHDVTNNFASDNRERGTNSVGDDALNAIAAASSPPTPVAATAIQQNDSATVQLTAISGSSGAASSGAADEGATALLVGSVDVAVTILLPPALLAVPRPLLGMAGSLIARYAISSLLPSFLDLLVADYGRWSSGQTVAARAAPAGDLVATAAANAVAMGATAPGARVQ